MIKTAYEVGADLAYESFDKEALFGLGALLRGAGRLFGSTASKLKLPGTLKAAPVAPVEGAGRFANTMHKAQMWQRNTQAGKLTQLPSWLLGMGPRRGAMWVGMPLGFGALNAGFAAPGEHKGKAFLKGVAGGLAFNALMPVGGLIGKGLFRGATAGAGGITSKAFAKGPGGKGFATAFGSLSAPHKLLRGGTAVAGVAGGLGLGIAGSHALESSLDPVISNNLGLRDSSVFNPAQLR